MEPVNKQNLYQQVLDRLITAISSSEFPPGSQLPSERELMNMIGVGRPSIREAMLSLQQMGLIRISHGERARVIDPTPDVIVEQISNAMVVLLSTSPRGLDELKEARIWLETALVRMAAANATDPDIRRLEESLRGMRGASGSPPDFVERDMAFHGLIAETSRNSLVIAVLKGMLHWLSRFKRDMVSVRGAEKLSLEEHERILDAIRAGDPDAASAAMTEHLTRANDLYRRVRKGEIQSLDD